MKVTYIYHSCFTVEIDNIVLIFDYFKGKLPEFSNDKQIYVFASHKHADHFSKKIFNLSDKYKYVTYILSKDIKMNEKYMNRIGINESAKDNIFYIGKNETQVFGNIKVETLTSTDVGVAFIISYNNNTIYHAGDLNWWSWSGETDEEYAEMSKRFVSEMNKIEGRHFDVAFLPLDPRQEENYWWGFDYFMRATNTDKAFPMHMWEDYSIIDRLFKNDCSIPYREKICNDIL